MRTPVITTPIRDRRVPFRSALAPLVACLLGACGSGSTFTQVATVENVSRTANVYALSGSAPELPAAYDMTTESYVRPLVLLNGTVNFQLAFDIDANGKVLLLPVRTIVPAAPAGTPSIGLLKSGVAYDLVARAADKGYRLDTAVVASVGDTYLLRLGASGCVYSEPFYGKLVIDSVFTATRRIVVRTLTNRNCGGYRSLSAGLPKD